MRALVLLMVAACGGNPPAKPPAKPAPIVQPAPPSVTWDQLHGPILSLDVQGGLLDEQVMDLAKDLQGKPLDRFVLRERLEQVMRLPGVGRVEAHGRQLADGITMTLVIEPAPKLRKLTAIDGSKEISITGMGAMPTGLAVDPARIDQIADRVRTQLTSPTRRSVEVQWRKVPVKDSAEVDIVLEVTD